MGGRPCLRGRGSEDAGAGARTRRNLGRGDGRVEGQAFARGPKGETFAGPHRKSRNGAHAHAGWGFVRVCAGKGPVRPAPANARAGDGISRSGGLNLHRGP